MIICKDKETGEIKKFKNVKAVLKDINRDRSQDWTNYTTHDWKEGLKVFTEYEIVKIIKGR
jgi:hypothetical protein